MFDNLTDKLDKAFHILKGHGKITDVNVADTLKEVRRALLDADVNFKIAKDFTTRVKDKAIGENVLTKKISHAHFEDLEKAEFLLDVRTTAEFKNGYI